MSSQSSRPGYEVRSFPLSRRLVIDSARVGRRRHIIHGLVEVDVTEARRLLREHGEALSFTAFVMACLGRAVDLNRHMHAYRDWRGRLILFDEVDITVLIEIELENQRFPLAHTIRAANQRAVRDIHAEIRAVQADPARSIGSQARQRMMRLFLWLPAPARDLLYRAVLRNPFWVKRYIGTVVLTAVGMFGQGGGWGISLPLHTLAVTLGGISEKPGVVEGRIEVREYLSVTLSFDHDIIDGAPAARFTQRFKELIESGYGLVGE